MDKELQDRLDKTDKALSDLPPPAPKDPTREVIRLISHFQLEASRIIEGTPAMDGLIQKIRIDQNVFKVKIRQSAPEFCPTTKPAGRLSTIRRRIPFLENEDGADEELPTRSMIFIDDVLAKAQQSALRIYPVQYPSLTIALMHSARTRELPGHYPFVVRTELISAFMKSWRHPALELCDAVERSIGSHMKDLVNRIFHNQTHGGLQLTVLCVFPPSSSAPCSYQLGILSVASSRLAARAAVKGLPGCWTSKSARSP